jgi:predicted dehydrogenase
LVETPPAADVPLLEALWRDVGASGLVQVAEQYLRMPGHAARLALVRGGLIGQPTSVEVASTHGYHAVAMMRGLLGVGIGPVAVTARKFDAPLLDPLGPDGWRTPDQPVGRETTVGVLGFGPSQTGVYNFVANQWWNPLRPPRLVVRGERGEICDYSAVRWVDGHGPVASKIIARRSGIDLNLEGNALESLQFDGQVLYRNHWAASRMSEDDVAVASQLAAMAAWTRGEAPPPYPLAHGCHDHAVALAIERSAATGQDVQVMPGPWAEWDEEPHYAPVQPSERNTR